MAEAGIFVAHDEFICPVCLDLLKDPVTVSCGHNFCKRCINDCWNQEDRKRVYSCPQCRETFTSRPVLRRNNILAEVLEKVRKTEFQAASAAQCHFGAADVECDSCTGRKLKAVKSCLVCLASFCETHIKPHYQSPAFKKHKLVEVSIKLKEKICSKHDKMMEIYCRTDQSCVCYLCTMDEHKGHDTVTAVAEREKRQNDLKEVQWKCEQRLQEKQKKVEEVKEAVITFKRSAQAAVEDSEMVFTELISLFEKKRSEMIELIRDHERANLSQAERHLEQLEQDITDLKRRNDELQQLSHTEDHIHFLQSFQSLRVSSESEDSSIISVRHHPSFYGVTKFLSGLKKRLEEFCREEFNKIPSQEPKIRKDFMSYFNHLTLDPNTVHCNLCLSENNREVRWIEMDQRYPNHPERFEHWFPQVLCNQSVCGRCYWEVEYNRIGDVDISVSYKEISRKGEGNECWFGRNNQSWSLSCSSSLSFWHNNIETKLSASPCPRIGVYVDHSAGTLSFYNVSDTMTLIHRVQTTFTQPLYAGFGLYYARSSVRLCDPE